MLKDLLAENKHHIPFHSIEKRQPFFVCSLFCQHSTPSSVLIYQAKHFVYGWHPRLGILFVLRLFGVRFILNLSLDQIAKCLKVCVSEPIVFIIRTWHLFLICLHVIWFNFSFHLRFFFILKKIAFDDEKRAHHDYYSINQFFARTPFIAFPFCSLDKSEIV